MKFFEIKYLHWFGIRTTVVVGTTEQEAWQYATLAYLLPLRVKEVAELRF